VKPIASIEEARRVIASYRGEPEDFRLPIAEALLDPAGAEYGHLLAKAFSRAAGSRTGTGNGTAFACTGKRDWGRERVVAAREAARIIPNRGGTVQTMYTLVPGIFFGIVVVAGRLRGPGSFRTEAAIARPGAADTGSWR
jgi:hypothetical protein